MGNCGFRSNLAVVPILGQAHAYLHAILREHRCHVRGEVAAVSPPRIPHAIVLWPATVNASTSVNGTLLLRLSKRVGYLSGGGGQLLMRVAWACGRFYYSVRCLG